MHKTMHNENDEDEKGNGVPTERKKSTTMSSRDDSNTTTCSRLETTLMELTEDMVGTTVWFEACPASNTLIENDTTQAMFAVLDFQLDSIMSFCSLEIQQNAKVAKEFDIKLQDFQTEFLLRLVFIRQEDEEKGRRMVEQELSSALQKVKKQTNAIRNCLKGYTEEWRKLIQQQKRNSSPTETRVSFETLRARQQQNNNVGMQIVRCALDQIKDFTSRPIGDLLTRGILNHLECEKREYEQHLNQYHYQIDMYRQAQDRYSEAQERFQQAQQEFEDQQNQKRREIDQFEQALDQYSQALQHHEQARPRGEEPDANEFRQEEEHYRRHQQTYHRQKQEYTRQKQHYEEQRDEHRREQAAYFEVRNGYQQFREQFQQAEGRYEECVHLCNTVLQTFIVVDAPVEEEP